VIQTVYLIRAIGFIVIGVVLASIIVETNILTRFGVLTKGVCRISNLSRGSVLALLACIMSSTGGKSMLETTLAVVMSTFPVVLGESLFRIHAPIAIALLGPAVGGIYVLLTLFAAFIQTFGALIASRLLLPKRACALGGADRSEDRSIALDWQTITKGARKAYPTLRKIVPILIISMLAIEVLLSLGAGIYIAKQFIHFTAGYATVNALLLNGVVTDKQAILTLLVGSMVVITMIYVKYSFSMYVSLFGKFGVTITAIHYASSMIAKVITILLVVMWY